jgi:hypothetical protein
VRRGEHYVTQDRPPRQLIGALQIESSVGTSTFDISASGLAASLLVSPTVIDFGFQPIGTTSSTRTLTIKNPNPYRSPCPTTIIQFRSRMAISIPSPTIAAPFPPTARVHSS